MSPWSTTLLRRMNPPDERVDPLFGVALKVADLTQRATHVEQDCAGDTAWRRKKEELLRAHEEARRAHS